MKKLLTLLMLLPFIGFGQQWDTLGVPNFTSTVKSPQIILNSNDVPYVVCEDVQDLKVRILNVVGEELINENLEQFIGEYTKQIDLSNNAKGIYFLEIETNDGIINKKLILQ